MNEGKDWRYYSSLENNLLTVIPQGMKRVLDVGCGVGVLGAALKSQGAKEVVGLELNEQAARKAEKHLDRVIVADVEQTRLSFPKGYFDCIVYGDVLEHLKDPWSLLLRHKQYLNQDGYVVASIPNVRYYSVILGLLQGRWPYQESGCLDNAHLRFFTLVEIKKMFSQAELRIIKILRNYFPRRRDKLLAKITFGSLREFLVFQYLIVAEKASN